MKVTHVFPMKVTAACIFSESDVILLPMWKQERFALERASDYYSKRVGLHTLCFRHGDLAQRELDSLTMWFNTGEERTMFSSCGDTQEVLTGSSLFVVPNGSVFQESCFICFPMKEVEKGFRLSVSLSSGKISVCLIK